MMVSCSPEDSDTSLCGTVELYEIDMGNPQISGDEYYIIYYSYINTHFDTDLKIKYINFNIDNGAIGEPTQPVQFYPIGSQYCE